MIETPMQNGHLSEASVRTRQRKAVIVGAGPVGCLAAIALANKGWAVEVYEGRAGEAAFSSTPTPSSAYLSFILFFLDKRLKKSEEGQRSINLVLSSRGLAALHTIDPFLEERLMKHTIPIHSRMVHMKDGSSSVLQYDPHSQASSFLVNRNDQTDLYPSLVWVPKQTINSISRSLLNEKLMEEALVVPNIRFFCEHKTQTVDFHRRTMNVRDVVGDTTKQVEFDLCIGADGSHSFVRRQLMRVTRYVSRVPYVRLSSIHVSPFASRRDNGILSSGPFR
jgi:kynurenine 3-monooxygenase